MVSGRQSIRLLWRGRRDVQAYTRQRFRGRIRVVGLNTVWQAAWHILVAGRAVDHLFARSLRETESRENPGHARGRSGDCGERQASALAILDDSLVACRRLDRVSGRGRHRSHFAGWQIHAEPDFTSVPGLQLLQGWQLPLWYFPKHDGQRRAVAALFGEREVGRGDPSRADRSSGLRGSRGRIQHPSRRQALPHLRGQIPVRYLDARRIRAA